MYYDLRHAIKREQVAIKYIFPFPLYKHNFVSYIHKLLKEACNYQIFLS